MQNSIIILYKKVIYKEKFSCIINITIVLGGDVINFIGCNAVLYDENSRQLYSGVATDMNSLAMHIVISGKSTADLPKKDKLYKLLIFTEKTTYEYNCRIGLVRENSVELYLSSSSTISDIRSAQRYDVDIIYTVRRIIIADKIVSIPKPIDINIKNISISGMLFQSKPLFNIGAKIEYGFGSEGCNLKVCAKIVRIGRQTKEYTEYGCKFVP